MDSIENILLELERRRHELGLSYQQLETRTGVSARTIQRLLGGRSTNARIATLVAIADVLGAQVGLVRKRTVNAILEDQARTMAGKLTRTSQASAAIEGLAAEPATLKKVKRDIRRRLLSGPRARLWGRTGT